MVSTVKCSNCGKELRYPLGTVMAHLSLGVQREPCNCCHRNVNHERHCAFCGPGCLKEFVLSDKWGLALEELAAR